MFFRNLTRENGLPSNNIRWITSDFAGYVWIATDNGAVRYDGTDMKVFRYMPGDNHSIAESATTVILRSPDSMIWIGTKNGLSVYSPFTGTFTNYQFNPDDPESFPADWILSLYDGGDGSLWIGTNNGIVRTTYSAEHFNLYQLHESDDPTDRKSLYRWVNRIVNHPRNTAYLILATRGGLLLFDKEKGRVIKDFDENSPHLYRCEALCLEGDSLIWTGEWDTGLKKFNLQSESWQVYNPPDSPNLIILGIVQKDNDELWLATVGKGAGLFSRRDLSFDFYLHTPDDPHSLCSDWLQSDFFTDDEKNIWIPTDKGISISDPEFHSFTLYGIPGYKMPVTAFLRDKESHQFYVGGNPSSGLFMWDEIKHIWSDYPPENKPPGRFNISNIIKDKNGIIWLTSSYGLFSLDKKKKLLVRYQDQNGQMLPMKDTLLYGLMEDHNGNLWVGSRFDGVFRINPDRSSFIHYENIPGNKYSLPPSKDFIAIHEDRRGLIWFGHYHGVSVFNPVNGYFRDNINDSLVKDGIRKGVIWGIGEDTLGRIYLSIEKEGLLRITREAESIYALKLFHLGHGLSDLNLFDITRDPAGNLWIINEGITRFDPYNETFQVIDTRNGLYSNKTWGDRVYCDFSGNLFMTAEEGYESINISNLDLKPSITHLNLEPVEINGNITPEGIQAGFTGMLTVPADNNNLVFGYKAICFRDPDLVKYTYILEGYDKDWILAGADTRARYTNLKPGNYIFHLKASHRGEWFPEEKLLIVEINPYFWQKTWFYIISALIIILIISGLYFFRLRQVRRKERLMAEFQKKLAESEMQALRAQMNPHFIFNSLNSINNFILKNETEAASDFLTKFSRLVRQVLNNSKNKLVTLEDELTALQLYLELEQLRFTGKFRFSVLMDRIVDSQRVLVPPLFMQPYVENAIWHGLMHKDDVGNILISVNMEGDNLKFIIEDDGIGREKAAEFKSRFGIKKQSMGMKITSDRIELLNELYGIDTAIVLTDLYRADGMAAGTRVEITLSFINQNLVS